MDTKQPPVLLLSGSLSYEGLDFIEMPTLVETGIDFQLVRMLQRDQRAHRIIQTEPCKVFFLYYVGTFQETALSLVAAKARAARKVDGKLVEGLSEMNAEEDLMSALIKAAMQEERPRVVDWGDLKAEEVLSRPEPLTVEQASEKLSKAAGPKQTLTVDLLDAVEEIRRRGRAAKEPSTRRQPVPVEDYQQLALF